MTGRTSQDMQDHGIQRLRAVIANYDGNVHVIEAFANSSHRPPPDQLMVHINGYDYLITIEFQDPR